MPRALEGIFSARGCAIVGASSNPLKAGCQIVANMKAAGYDKGIFPINPSGGEILGLKTYASVAEIAEPVELVVLAAPAASTPAILADLGRRMAEKKDLAFLVCSAAGFAEVGTAEGIGYQEALASFCSSNDIRLVGPNCVGVIDPVSRIDTTFIAGIAHVPGGISLASQSGSVGAWFLMNWSSTAAGGVGFRRFITVGNMADVTIIEGIRNLADDPATKVLGLYIEGSPQARELVEAAGMAARKKPVAALKVGASEEGARAAKSHTGSLAGSDALYEGSFEQLGIARAASPRELSNILRSFDSMPLPKGPRTFVLTQAGGPGIFCMDQMAGVGNLATAYVSDETKAALVKCTPPISSICHPEGHADITAAATAAQHADSLEAVLRDGGVDSVIFITVATLFLDLEEMARNLAGRMRALKSEGISKPVFFIILSGNTVQPCRDILEREGYLTWDSPEYAVRVLSHMTARAEFEARLAREGGDR